MAAQTVQKEAAVSKRSASTQPRSIPSPQISVILTLSGVEWGRVPAFAVALHLRLHLPLSLLVSAVILSAAKDPEEFHSPRPVEPFNPSLIVAVAFFINQRIVISTEAAHAFVSSGVEKSASLLLQLPCNSASR
jgi:hypothetical protein